MALNGIGENYDFMKEHEKARNTFQQVYDQAQNNNQKYGALFSIARSFMFEGADVAAATVDAADSEEAPAGDAPAAGEAGGGNPATGMASSIADMISEINKM